jgi:uncharacterized protein (DUF1778 family)
MPAKNPRIAVTVSPERYELIRRLAELQGRSMGSVMNEVFDQVEPVLERVCVVLEAAHKAQDEARTGLKERAESAEKDLQPLLEQAMSQFDMFIQGAKEDAEGEPPGSNHGGQVSHEARNSGKSGS